MFSLLSTSFYTQDDEEYDEDPACLQVPADKKVLKLYEKGLDKKKYAYKDRIRHLKDALELDEDCSACMWEIAKLTYRRAQANGDNILGVLNIDMMGYDGDNDDVFDIDVRQGDASSIAMGTDIVAVLNSPAYGFTLNVTTVS